MFQVEIKSFYKNITFKDSNYVITDKNEYYRDYDFDFVQNVTSFVADDYQDILNIYYSGLNTGSDRFEFKCSSNYENCVNDVSKIANDNALLSDINNFVHPFNTFKNINTTYNNLGIVSVDITHAYTKEEINEVNNKVNALYPTLAAGYEINNEESAKNAIRTIHDYIINTTKYDSDRADKGITNYKSDIAIGPLYEGYALCGGYTDLLEIFLYKMNIKCYRISADKHIWNAIEINNIWYNLDITWDDPVTNTGEQMLLHDYFLISTKQMLSQDTSEHTFNQDIYSELKST